MNQKKPSRAAFNKHLTGWLTTLLTYLRQLLGLKD